MIVTGQAFFSYNNVHPQWRNLLLRAALEVRLCSSHPIHPDLKKGVAMPADTLTITDNRTGKTYDIPITHGTVKASDLRQIKTGPDDFGLMSYDPAFMNTASP